MASAEGEAGNQYGSEPLDSVVYSPEDSDTGSGVAEFETRRKAESEKLRIALEVKGRDGERHSALATAEFWAARQAEFEKYSTSFDDLAAHWTASRGWRLWWGETREDHKIPKECRKVFNALARKALKVVPGLAALNFEPWQGWLEFMHYHHWQFEVTTSIPGSVQRVWESSIQNGIPQFSFRDEVKYTTDEPNKWQYGLLIRRVFHISALFCLERTAEADSDSLTVSPNAFGDSEPIPDAPGALGATKKSLGAAAAAKHARAVTVAKVIKELNDIKPQMFEDETQYQVLRARYAEFLTFQIAEVRPDLKMKVLAIRGSTRHIRLAQEIAGAHHGRQLSTIQDDWKDHKPPEFRRQQ
jgi:hypothetical protein